MRYTASITSASLRLRESRIVAGLLLKGVSPREWQTAITEQNVLKLRSPKTAQKVSELLRSRLEPMGEGLWIMVRDGGRELATQAAFAAAVKTNRILGDFMDIAMREQRALFATKIERHVWNGYIAGCRGRDPEMPLWSDATVDRLRSSVYSMLAEAGYLKDTRTLILQNVFLDRRLATYLGERREKYVLRCMEVTE
jgi:hypothetical protein